MTKGIDLSQARALADAGAASDSVMVSRRWLRQAVSELETARTLPVAEAEAEQPGAPDIPSLKGKRA